jgi:hypothetical protein
LEILLCVGEIAARREPRMASRRIDIRPQARGGAKSRGQLPGGVAFEGAMAPLGKSSPAT